MPRRNYLCGVVCRIIGLFASFAGLIVLLPGPSAGCCFVLWFSHSRINLKLVRCVWVAIRLRHRVVLTPFYAQTAERRHARPTSNALLESTLKQSAPPPVSRSATNVQSESTKTVYLSPARAPTPVPQLPRTSGAQRGRLSKQPAARSQHARYARLDFLKTARRC